MGPDPVRGGPGLSGPCSRARRAGSPAPAAAPGCRGTSARRRCSARSAGARPGRRSTRGRPPRWHSSVRDARNLIQPIAISSFAERSVASGLAMSRPMDGQVEERRRGDELVHQRLHDPLLALGAGDVAVARIGGVADAGVGERVAAVEVDRALAEVPDQAVERHRRDHLVRVLDGDPAERVDQVAEAGEVDQHDVVHAQAGQPVDRADQKRRPAEGERGVDLVRAVAGDRARSGRAGSRASRSGAWRGRCARAGSSPTGRRRSRLRRGCPSP